MAIQQPDQTEDLRPALSL